MGSKSYVVSVHPFIESDEIPRKFTHYDNDEDHLSGQNLFAKKLGQKKLRFLDIQVDDMVSPFKTPQHEVRKSEITSIKPISAKVSEAEDSGEDSPTEIVV